MLLPAESWKRLRGKYLVQYSCQRRKPGLKEGKISCLRPCIMTITKPSVEPYSVLRGTARDLSWNLSFLLTEQAIRTVLTLMLNDPWIALFIFSQVSVVTVRHVCPPLSAQETLSSSVIETTARSSLMNWEEHRLGT